MKETQLDLLPSGDEPEEGRALPRRHAMSSRRIALLNWIRANGPVSSDAIPLGMKLRDLRDMELEGLLTGEGAQVRTFRLKEVRDDQG